MKKQERKNKVQNKLPEPDTGLLAIICMAVAIVLYANTLFHEYTVDDGTVIKNNKLTTAGIKSIPEIVTSSYRAGFWERNEGLYRPLSVVMFAIEWQIAPDQPWLGHLINILLYGVTAYILLKFFIALFPPGKKIFAFLGTLLFIVHPVHTEVVANIKSRDELLCFLFSIASLFQIMKWISGNKRVHLIISMIFFLLALFSKESAITLLPVFPLLIWFAAKAGRKQIIATTTAAAVTATLFLLIRQSVLHGLTATDSIQLINNTLVGTEDRLVRFATAISIMGKYLMLLFIPARLVFDYSYNTIPLVSLSNPSAFIPMMICLAFAWIAVRNIKSRRLWAFGILFFFITISLVSNIVFLIEATMAERFLYMPSAGFSIAIASVASSFIKEKGNKEFFHRLISKPEYILFTAVLLIFSIRTIVRNNDWKNNLTLLSKDVKSAPNSARIQYAYGSAILVEQALQEKDKDKKQQLLQSAIAHLEKGVSIIEDYSDAWYHLGIAYKEANDPVNAIRSFEKSRSYKPFKDAEAYIASALAYGLAGKYDKAINDLNAALQKDPSSTEALNNLGLYYNDFGRTQQSLDALNKAIALKPDFAKAWYNMGNTYARTGNYTVALEKYKKAISIDPGYGDAYNNSGNCFSALHMTDSALVYYTKAVETDPSNVKAVTNLGVIHNQRGDTAKAKYWFDQARALGANF